MLKDADVFIFSESKNAPQNHLVWLCFDDAVNASIELPSQSTPEYHPEREGENKHQIIEFYYRILKYHPLSDAHDVLAEIKVTHNIVSKEGQISEKLAKYKVLFQQMNNVNGSANHHHIVGDTRIQ